LAVAAGPAADSAAVAAAVSRIAPGPIETPIFGRIGLSNEQVSSLQLWKSQAPSSAFGFPSF
jgi:hypothetical protein